MILGLNHVTIAVRNLDRSFLFYSEVLGFTPLMKHSRGAYFLAGNAWFCLDLDPQTRIEALPEYTHFAFSVSQENFQIASDRIITSGAAIWSENKSEGDSLYFLDPDGHKLEIHVGNWRSRLRSAYAKPWSQSLQLFDVHEKAFPRFTLEVQSNPLAITKLKSADLIPNWAQQSSFFSISRTPEELSIVCQQCHVPESIKSEKNWCALKVKGPLDFSLTGVLASLTQSLAEKGVSLFAISTLDTNYILVKSESLERAIAALEFEGHSVQRRSESHFVQKGLSTERLSLESITEGHAQELFELFADPELHTFVPFEPPTLEEQRKKCARWEKRKSPDGGELWLNWMARDLATKAPVGHFQAGVKKGGIASIGYVVAREFQNRGLATEALSAVFSYLKNDLNVQQVKAWSDTRNLASHKLAKKMGMIQVELIKNADFFKGSSSDEFVFAKELK